MILYTTFSFLCFVRCQASPSLSGTDSRRNVLHPMLQCNFSRDEEGTSKYLIQTAKGVADPSEGASVFVAKHLVPASPQTGAYVSSAHVGIMSDTACIITYIPNRTDCLPPLNHPPFSRELKDCIESSYRSRDRLRKCVDWCKQPIAPLRLGFLGWEPSNFLGSLGPYTVSTAHSIMNNKRGQSLG